MTNKKFLARMSLMMLTFGLVLSGCPTESGGGSGGGGGGGADLSDFVGTYNGAFTAGGSYAGTSLTVSENSLKSGSTEIKGVTTSAGGSGSGVSWVYLNAGGKKIGIALTQGATKAIYLGTTVVKTISDYTFKPSNITQPSGIEDGAITGTGAKQ